MQGFFYAIASAASLVFFLGWSVAYATKYAAPDLSFWSDCSDRKTHFACVDYQEKITTIILGNIISVILFASSVAFLRGIYQKRPSLLLHYIRLLGLDTAISLGAIFYSDVFKGFGDEYWLPEIANVLVFALKLHMFLCANSLWHKMMVESEQEGRPQPNLDSVMIYTTAMQEKEKEANATPIVVGTSQCSSLSALPPAYQDSATSSNEPTKC